MLVNKTDSRWSTFTALQPQQCYVTLSWAHCLTTNIKLRSCICLHSVSLFVCAPVSTCLCLCVSMNAKCMCVCPVRGGHVANRKVLMKYLFSKQSTDWANNVPRRDYLFWEDNGDSGTESWRDQTGKWAFKMFWGLQTWKSHRQPQSLSKYWKHFWSVLTFIYRYSVNPKHIWTPTVFWLMSGTCLCLCQTWNLRQCSA